MFNIGDKVRLKAADLNEGTYAREELEFGKVYTVSANHIPPVGCEPLVSLEECESHKHFAEGRFELATVPEVNVGDKIRVTHLQRGVRRTVEGVVGEEYTGTYYTEHGDYLGMIKAAEKPENHNYDAYTIEVIEKAKPKLPTELGTVLRHKDRNAWAVVRVDSDGTPWLGSVESSDDYWFTDAEVQELLDSGNWVVQ